MAEASRPAAEINPNVICGVCNEVFHSPRIIPRCHHSFCVECLDCYVRTYGAIFPCPTCMITVMVPSGGITKLTANIEFTEEYLECERRKTYATACATHPTKNVKLFCQICVKPICLSCKEDGHAKHRTEELSRMADRCRKMLQANRNVLVHHAINLSRQTTVAQVDAQEANEKAGQMKAHLMERHNSFITMLTNQRNRTLRDLDDLANKMDEDLAARLAKDQRRLNNVVKLQQRVIMALDNNDPDFRSGNNLEVVVVEKEVRAWQGSMRGLSNGIQGTLRVGIQGDSMLQGGMRPRQLAAMMFGQPMRMRLPLQLQQETITNLYRCGERGDASCEVQAVCYLYSSHIQVAYGGTDPAYLDATSFKIKVGENGAISRRRISYFSYGRLHMYNGLEEVLCSKSESDARLVLRENCLPKAFLMSQDSPQSDEVDFDLEDAWTPLVADTNYRGDMMVVLSENVYPPPPANDKNKKKRKKKGGASTAAAAAAAATTCAPGLVVTGAGTRRLLQLYISGQSKPMASYTPPHEPFFPTDVCFRRFDHTPHQVVIADLATDSIHLVSVEDNRFNFLRYMASGSSILLRPTALDTYKDNVYVGCENGKVLCLEPACSTDGSNYRLEEDKENQANTE